MIAIITNKKEKENNMIEITQKDFLEYKAIQESGQFNMFDPQAREMTNLSKEQWVKIMQEYKKLNEAWGNDDK
jgi:hypothetical protein|tara:strand:+ start:3741 stop:3959 length:219 start_codon:yes stop_codon:yes gene_type:complete